MKKIYYNGDFITLAKQDVEAIMTENDTITKVGKKEEILNLKDNETELINLKGNTMMPSFIDTHGHFFAVANNMLNVSLSACKNFNDIKEKLYNYKIKEGIKDGEWIVANGYDHNNLLENRHITKEILDSVLPNNPVIIQHASGHSGILNSKTLEKLNITINTKSPEGGKIEKINNKLTGYLEENAFLECQKKVPMPSKEKLLKSLIKAQEKYASYGITTIQEGYMIDELVGIYKELVEKNQLFLDVVAFADEKLDNKIKEEFPNNLKKYYNNFKIGGFKIFLDGSPQSRTAWMRTPYIDDENYYGYGTMQSNEVENAIEKAFNEDMQILVHCNGDKAAEQYIDVVKNINKTQSFNTDIAKIRPVLIHGQLLGIDQLDDIKKLGIIPSYFVAHTYYWGETHIKNFGIDRASKICPLRSTKNRNIIFTLHQDAPVIEPNMFETIWCAVNRITRDGRIIGKNETIDVLDAIKAVTINAAYQYFEENTKGSIQEGKKANLIVVDRNPLKIDKNEIRKIKVLETIKDGKNILTNLTN